MKKRIFLLCCSVMLLFGCGQKEVENAQKPSTQEENTDSSDETPEQSCQAKVTFFDVGKGDAILIETSEHQIMIDAGYDDTSEIILDYLKEQGIESLDYMLITHFDKDHVGGADRIMEEIRTERVLQPDYESDSGQYQEYREIMERQGISPEPITKTTKLSLDGVDFLIYPPQRKSYGEEDNDFSLVVSMVCGERSFLFAGDAEKERLKELLIQNEFGLSHDVLKVPHHGRKEKNSEEFLKAVSPELAVITSSEEKPADEEVCKILEKLGTDIYFTCDGTVTCICDGRELLME